MDIFDDSYFYDDDDDNNDELNKQQVTHGLGYKLYKLKMKLKKYFKYLKNTPHLLFYFFKILSSKREFLNFCKEFWNTIKNTPIFVFYGYLWKTKKIQFFMNIFVSYGLPILLEALPWYFSRRKIGRQLRTQKNTITNTMIYKKGFNLNSAKTYILLTFLYTLLENLERHLNFRVTLLNRLYVKRLVLEKILFSEVYAFNELQGRELEYRITTEIHNTLRLFSFIIPSILSSIYAIVRESYELYENKNKLDFLIIIRPILSIIIWKIIDWLKIQFTGRKKIIVNVQSNPNVTFLFNNVMDGLNDIQLNNMQYKKLKEYDDIVNNEFGIFEDLRLFFNRIYSSFTNRGVFDFLSETYVASIIMEKKGLDHEEYRKLQIDIDHLVKLFKRTGNYIYQASRTVERQNRVVQLMRLPNFMNEDLDLDLIRVNDFNDLIIKDITFSYHKNGKRPFALHFKGEIKFTKDAVYGLIGQNRSGKSTLVNLITKLYSPLEGELLFNGISYNQINRNSIRNVIYYVPQKPYIFPGTIKENICMGIDYVPTEKEIIKAAKYAGVFTFDDASISSSSSSSMKISNEQDELGIITTSTEKTISQLLLEGSDCNINSNNDNIIEGNNDNNNLLLTTTSDNKKKKLSKKKIKKILNMRTEPRGSNLSGGFAQSVALARIYLQKQAKVFILDESTSAMDPIKKRDTIYPNLLKYIRKNKLTLIMISHDMSCLELVDKVIMLSNGKIACQGSHRELIEGNNEAYLQMLGIPSKL
ncbi:hypothetical protein ABK040_001475 [Willaertia magna]